MIAMVLVRVLYLYTVAQERKEKNKIKNTKWPNVSQKVDIFVLRM